MSSFTTTNTRSSTITDAKYLASKVATDLMRFHRFYGSPTQKRVEEYEQELTTLLKFDGIDSVVYGFRRNGLWTLASVRYVVMPGGALQIDDDPGRIKPNHDVSGATFSSFLSFTDRWFARSQEERDRIRASLPFQRTTGDTPGLEKGSWETDKNYSSSGLGVSRSTVRY
ncbi:hypothetical protein NKI86_06960 [Mesorhizobium sp. M0320]|uniref:HORMA-1 domain-containing protein n=1 Tax=Mesorhizobium sp. M0320 TaxID=2956936 RepID=UPI00333C0A4E